MTLGSASREATEQALSFATISSRNLDKRVVLIDGSRRRVTIADFEPVQKITALDRQAHDPRLDDLLSVAQHGDLRHQGKKERWPMTRGEYQRLMHLFARD